MCPHIQIVTWACEQQILEDRFLIRKLQMLWFYMHLQKSQIQKNSHTIRKCSVTSLEFNSKKLFFCRDAKVHVVVDPLLGNILRPHQRVVSLIIIHNNLNNYIL